MKKAILGIALLWVSICLGQVDLSTPGGTSVVATIGVIPSTPTSEIFVAETFIGRSTGSVRINPNTPTPFRVVTPGKPTLEGFIELSQDETLYVDLATEQVNTVGGETNTLIATPQSATQTQASSSVAEYGVSQYARSGTSTGSDLYNCSDFATENEAQEHFLAAGGPSSDPNDLDRDGDGYACEYDPRQEIARPATPTSSRCPAGEHWVNGYTRKGGANVRGHCRKN